MEDAVRHLLQERRYAEALEQLLDLYERKVFRMAVAMLRDTGRAEEVTQDVFVKVWRELPSYDGRASLSTWVYTIARNTCLSAVRSESYRKTALRKESQEPTVASIDPLTLALKQCLSRLPDIQRDAITMFYFEDRNVAEVAKLMDLPEGTVKSHLHRARRALAEMME